MYRPLSNEEVKIVVFNILIAKCALKRPIVVGLKRDQNVQLGMPSLISYNLEKKYCLATMHIAKMVKIV